MVIYIRTYLFSTASENISKIFSFKNIIDEFYLNFLEKETALIEIFIVKSG